MLFRFSALVICTLFTPWLALADSKNVADPAKHPYSNTAGGRAGYANASATVNEARLYDFYQRQADYYMAMPAADRPAVLPAYPGLDGGKHGHWGKHNQNGHQDARWNDAEMGEVLTQVLRHGKQMTVLKGICVRLGEERELSACFDPMSLSYRSIWQGGFVKFEGFRWGTSRNAHVVGKPWYTTKEAKMPDGGKYLGFYRYGKRTVFHYKIGDTEILDEPWADGDTFLRRIDVLTAATALPFSIPDNQYSIVSKSGIGDVTIGKGNELIKISSVEAGAQIILVAKQSGEVSGIEKGIALLQSERKITRRWTEVVKSPGTLGTAKPDSAYIVDTLTVPYENPYNVVMQLSGLAFLPSGDALACTLQGDIWRVSGITHDLSQVTWQRYASGLNQPIGIHIDQDGVFVLDRGQIYRLHDTNDDGEVDYYENYANDFGGFDRSHTHTFGLHRTGDGAFHFTQRESILRTGPDRTTSHQGWGVRNCMGIGGSKDYFWVAPQEGTWTPASAIIEVNDGEFYGLPSAGKSGTIAAPLCFIPRGVDNSTGGMVEIPHDHWGPFRGSHVGLSYGSGCHYLILRDDTGARPQGAVVPLEGEFLAGSMRGAFHPRHGQLYLVGLDGWGDYSLKDGCFHRVRYTGGEVLKPNGFQVYENGIRIDFPTALDAQAAEDTSNYFAHVWNYEYAKRYGSPEFSTKEKSLGHDIIDIRSVSLLDSGQSIFVEMPGMEPVMQLHIRMHLQSAGGQGFKTDLFASPMYLGEHFSGTSDLAPPTKGKPNAIALRTEQQDGNDTESNTTSGELIEGARDILVDAIGGLQYAQTLIEAKPGEALAWKLRNTDVMPHNLVLVKPGATKAVGEASFGMLNDPEAGKKHYVPEMTEVITYIPVINPNTEHTLYLHAPQEPGDYPYICTYPGHWMAMQGILRVK